MAEPIDFFSYLQASPTPYLILAPDLTITDVNAAYEKTVKRPRHTLVGRNVFDVFPASPGDPDDNAVFLLQQSFQRVLTFRKPDVLTMHRYPIPVPVEQGLQFEERYWTALNTPLLDHHGNMVGICHHAMDMTEIHALKNTMRAARIVEQEVSQQDDSRSAAIRATVNVLDAERQLLRQLFEQTPSFTAFMRSPEHVFELVNPAFSELIGHRNVIGKMFKDAFPEFAHDDFIERLDAAYKSGEAYTTKSKRIVLNLENGAKREAFVDLVYQPITEIEGSVSGIFLQGNDVTEQKLAEDERNAALEESARLALVAQKITSAVTITDNKGIIEWVNPAFTTLTGYTAEEATGKPLVALLCGPDTSSQTVGVMENGIRSRTSFEVDVLHYQKSGQPFWQNIKADPVLDGDHSLRHFIAVQTDISEKKKSDDLIWQQANYDPLTSLPNRRLFRNRLDQEMRKAYRSGQQIGLLLIDLDRFKEANDLLGHDAGDVLLEEAARRICACVRDSDTVARLGGDEFTVIMTALDDEAHVERTAERITDALVQPYRLGSEVVYLSASTGITLYPEDATSLEALIRNADQAMYAAKNAGRNQFSYFTRSMQDRAHARIRLGGDLRSALDGGQLHVYYQPVIDLSTGRIAKAEALLRWRHPTLGPVEPSRFIPIAEELGMINQIGDWVFKEAASCSKRWSEDIGAPFQVSVNKSPIQFLSDGEAVDWLDHLRHLGLPGNSLTVEITEGLLLKASPQVTERLLHYRDAGIQVALDDFGTGYSSMSYLKKFDIDYLKIDQSFIRDMEVDRDNRAIAESIIAMAHKLGIKVIAEGIETNAQEALLRSAGCDYGQGYLFSQPLTSAEFEQLLSTRPRGSSASLH
ncbi:MAG TPA: EAL domain-containing protein [Noviherbaspirillum sp.]|uniref:sensor domain-containing protein n=1 Tax=Noviherbaspirillum sp. TaxID=1926288 RepID=UPI002D677AA9|nr:EAL domain-containing protein [Noviherbaspirillum sp.]HYD95275.1 EAL domain-containing protein [Noviherbaspirillum sp.]